MYLTIIDDCSIEAEFKFIEKTDIDELTETTIALYPNPATTKAQITANDVISNVVIRSIQGKTVYQENGFNESMEINLTNLKSGLYIVTITLQNGETRQEKLMVGK